MTSVWSEDVDIPGNFSDSRYRPWPRVKQFLADLEPGAFVCDVGMHPKYLDNYTSIFIVLLVGKCIETSILISIIYLV